MGKQKKWAGECKLKKVTNPGMNGTDDWIHGWMNGWDDIYHDKQMNERMKKRLMDVCTNV